MIEVSAIDALTNGPLATTSTQAMRPDPTTDMLANISEGRGFSAILADGMETMNTKLAEADRMIAKFAIDDSVPLHQVTIALEEARLSVEIAMQMRARMVEGYRELMNMQL